MNRLIKICKYLTALGVIIFGAWAVFIQGDKVIYLGFLTLCMSLHVFSQAFDLQVREKNRVQAVTSFIVGALILIISMLIIFDIMN